MGSIEKIKQVFHRGEHICFTPWAKEHLQNADPDTVYEVTYRDGYAYDLKLVRGYPSQPDHMGVTLAEGWWQRVGEDDPNGLL